MSFTFYKWTDAAMGFTKPHVAIVLYMMARRADADGVCFPGQAATAKSLGIPVRNVTRAMAVAQKQKMITRLPRTNGRRTYDWQLNPPGMWEQLATRGGVKRGIELATRGRQQLATCGEVQVATRGRTESPVYNELVNQTTKPEIEPETESSSIAGYSVSDTGRKAAAIGSTTTTEEQDMTTREEMMAALHRPIQDYGDTGGIPAGRAITISTLPRLDAVDIATHARAFQASSDRPWPSKWDAWLMRFLPYMTVDQHQYWMAEIFDSETRPNLKWHTSVVHRILSGGERQPYVPHVEPERTYGSKPTMQQRVAAMDAEERYR